MEPISSYITKLARNVFRSIENHDNPIIRAQTMFTYPHPKLKYAYATAKWHAQTAVTQQIHINFKHLQHQMLYCKSKQGQFWLSPPPPCTSFGDGFPSWSFPSFMPLRHQPVSGC
ncbi:hypothetical protein TNCV_1460301 [Trichonephila clavipes]|nr:hypothetical protein TNCV_1460301 [Trichonephila clavipes]